MGRDVRGKCCVWLVLYQKVWNPVPDGNPVLLNDAVEMLRDYLVRIHETNRIFSFLRVFSLFGHIVVDYLHV